MNNRSYSVERLTGAPRGAGGLRRAVRSAVDAMDDVDRVRGQGPARAARCFVEGAHCSCREAVENGPGGVGVALLDARSGSDDRLRPDRAEVADDGGRLDD